MMHDLDNWVSNLYFEIEKVNLMDIKVDESNEKLYYSPVSGVTPQEQQQLLKMHREESEEMVPEDDHFPAESQNAQSPRLPPGASQSNPDGSVLNASQHLGASAMQSQRLAAIDEEEDSDLDSSSDEEEVDEEAKANRRAELYTEMHYTNEKSADEVNYDNYHFSVAQKYDLT